MSSSGWWMMASLRGLGSRALRLLVIQERRPLGSTECKKYTQSRHALGSVGLEKGVKKKGAYELGERGFMDKKVSILQLSHDAIKKGGIRGLLQDGHLTDYDGKDSGPRYPGGLGYKSPYHHHSAPLKRLMTANLVVKDGDIDPWVTPDTETLNEYAEAERRGGVRGRGSPSTRPRP